MTNPTTIARSLSEAQRAALVLHRTHQAWGGRTQGAELPNWSEAGISLRGLRLIDFVDEVSALTRITVLGQSVRAAILAEQEGGAS